MAIFTPRGLKLRLPVNYAFALMARLHPKTDAFRVLQKTEEVENLGGLAVSVVSIVVFICRVDPIMIGAVVFGTSLVFNMIHRFGFYVPPFTFLFPISRVYSWFSGYGIYFIGVIVLGLFTVGWKGLLANFAGRALAGVVAGQINMSWGRKLFEQTGMSLTMSERSFFYAYRLEANKLGESISLDVEDHELDEEHWMPAYEHLEYEWPDVTARFTPN